MSFLYSVKSIFRALFVEAGLSDLSFGLFHRLKLPALMRQRRWPEFEQALLGVSPDELSTLLDELCLTNRHHPQVLTYLQTADSELSRLVAGVYHTHTAWERRSSYQASELTQSQVNGFFEHLEQAHRALCHDFSAPKLQVEALARRIRVEMGLSEKQEAHKSFAAAVSLQPGHLLAYLNHFKLLLPKWLGSEPEVRELLDFADDADTRQLLRLMYLVEMYTDLYYDDPKNAGRQLQQQYAADIEAALAAPRPIANGSVKAVYAANYLACLYDILGRRKDRQQLIQQLGNRFTVHPWAYFDVRGRRQIEALNLG
ncbi:hypothetical protein EJV47_19590 [Hymenobacter gummosus]|uniref:Uncharacterized protein n=1 Tax=Hymenobacter gummosus TaxID=1776032 RepID=A0A3S0JBY2_9BACT|nr:hypothetical protein [Hymenobacter gummosus]RTQ47102.1 hypothetical protein EJV47_19590 [Hymenobacter gummosus]